MATQMEGIPSEVNYFEKDLVQTAFMTLNDLDVHPIATLQHGAPIEFLIRGADNLYLDLNNSKLEIKAKITLADGGNLAAANVVGPVNNVLHSIFSSIDMELCGKSVNEPNQLYPYRAYLETLLTYGEDVLKTRHLIEGWDKDTAGQMAVTAPAGDNLGLRQRTARFALSNVVTLIGRPHLDLFHQDKLIPPKCDIKLRLIPNSDQWILKNAAATQQNPQVNYKFEITDARFWVHRKALNPSLAVAHETMLLKTNFRLPITTGKIKTQHIPQGTNSYMIDNLFLGEIPDRVVVGFVRDDAITGSWTLNPFDFENYNINYLVMKVNGEQVPHVALTPNFVTGDYIKAYCHCLEALGIDNGQQMIDLKPTEWATGFTCFVFKFSPGPPGLRTLTRTGSVRMEVKFGTPTPRNISAIIFAEHPSVLEIDKFRNVITS